MCFEKNRKPWTIQEQSLLKNLYESLGPKNWKKISKQFKKQGLRRKQIEIRQKWINHMDPEISNENWNNEELEILYRQYDDLGSKWCLIRNFIPGRTQIKIKNKFYSNIRVYIRFVMLYIEGKNCGNKQLINRIAPNVLNQIYHGQKRFQHLGDQFRSVLSQMGYIIDKSVLERRIQNKRDLYENFNQAINLILRQITSTQEFKNILENDQSYYSEIQSEKQSKPILTRSRIGTNLALKPILSDVESSVFVKQQQNASFHQPFYQHIYRNPQWSSVIVIQPRRIPLEQVFYYSVYFPWQMVKSQ